MTPKPTGPRPHPQRPWADLLALTIITTAVVVLVVLGQAGVAVLTAAGSLIVAALHEWHSAHRH